MKQLQFSTLSYQFVFWKSLHKILDLKVTNSSRERKKLLAECKVNKVSGIYHCPAGSPQKLVLFLGDLGFKIVLKHPVWFLCKMSGTAQRVFTSSAWLSKELAGKICETSPKLSNFLRVESQIQRTNFWVEVSDFGFAKDFSCKTFRRFLLRSNAKKWDPVYSLWEYTRALRF